MKKKKEKKKKKSSLAFPESISPAFERTSLGLSVIISQTSLSCRRLLFEIFTFKIPGKQEQDKKHTHFCLSCIWTILYLQLPNVNNMIENVFREHAREEEEEEEDFLNRSLKGTLPISLQSVLQTIFSYARPGVRACVRVCETKIRRFINKSADRF